MKNYLKLSVFLILSLLGAPAVQAQQYQWNNFAGSPTFSGSVDGNGTSARFKGPCGVAVDSSGNVYVADTSNNTIRMITSGGTSSTMAGFAGFTGSNDNTTGTSARFKAPFGLAVDHNGTVYVADTGNHTIRKITSAGAVTTLAGQAGFTGSTDNTGPAARFSSPSAVAVDSNGNVYVADTGNHTIRMITSAGVVSTLAGFAGQTGSSDNTGSLARFSSPSGVAVDSSGNVYVADTGNHTIRMVTSGGVASTVAGTAGLSGSLDGTGSGARFKSPDGVTVDSSGTLYVADTVNETIRKIATGGVVTTIGGTAGSSGSAAGLGTAARFFLPTAVAVDGSGNLFIADSSNQRISQGLPVNAPIVISPTSAGITATTATLGGNVTGDGGSPITERGVVYSPTSTNSNPQIGGTGVVKVTGTGTTGVFTTSVTSLIAATGYSFAAYATNSIGTTYTTPVSTFSTGTAPTVTSPSSASITATTATLGGNVTGNGGSTITERGVVYSPTSTNSNPQIGGTGVAKVTASGTTGVFTASVSSLTAGSGYSFAAYATNSIGTTYTPVATFTTLTSLQNWRQTYFGTTANSGSAADTADYDNDGIPNLVEYALGLNPTVESTLGTTTAINGTNFEYTYTRSVGALNAGTVFTVQWSTTLVVGSWSNTGVTQTVQSDNGTTQQVKAVIPINGATALFVRLSITAPP